MSTTDHLRTSRRIVGAAALAGTVAVAVNLAIRALVLALLDKPRAPYPLVIPPVVLFAFLPCLLGAAVFLILRRATTRPVYWFTRAAVAVLVLSWAAPLIGFLRHDPHREITIGVLLALLLMHATPAVLLVTTLRRITGWKSIAAQ
jgi:hypothetical protein